MLKVRMRTEGRLPDLAGSVRPLVSAAQKRYDYLMNKTTETTMTNSNPYVQTLIEKGYTAAEIRQTATPSDKRVPAWLRDRYATYEEYQDAIHDFLNGQ